MMNDFDKLREAAEEIKLDDLQRQKILDACNGKKRRKFNYRAAVGIAAALVITFAVFSPGFLIRAGMSDKATNEAEIPDYKLFADNETFDIISDDFISQNSGSSENGAYLYTAGEYTLNVFEASGFRCIYSAIPHSFIALVGDEAYKEWSSSVRIDGGMAIAQFVEAFGITREDFDSANRIYANYIRDFYGVMPLYSTSYAGNEIYEIFNTELIYSADRKAIDEYYSAFAETEYPQDSGIGGSRPAEIIVPEDYYK